MTVDYGDYVVVTNARKIVVSGNKADQIVYRHHTMFPGGLHERKYKNLMKEQPEEVNLPLLSFSALTMHHRSFASQFLVCFQRIPFAIEEWNDLKYSRLTKWKTD